MQQHDRESILAAGRPVVLRSSGQSATEWNRLMQEGGLGLGKERGFRQLVHKDPGRYDLNLDHEIAQCPLPRGLFCQAHRS